MQRLGSQVMRKSIYLFPVIVSLTMYYGSVHATTTPTVPEIDGGIAAIGIGLTFAVVALVREHRRKK